MRKLPSPLRGTHYSPLSVHDKAGIITKLIEETQGGIADGIIMKSEIMKQNWCNDRWWEFQTHSQKSYTLSDQSKRGRSSKDIIIRQAKRKEVKVSNLNKESLDPITNEDIMTYGRTTSIYKRMMALQHMHRAKDNSMADKTLQEKIKDQDRATSRLRRLEN